MGHTQNTLWQRILWLVAAVATSTGHHINNWPGRGNGPSTSNSRGPFGQPSVVKSTCCKKEKINQVKSFPYRAACTIFWIYIFTYAMILNNSVMGYVQNKAMVDSHHVIFDNLGKLSTGITYINVAIPLNISIFTTQLELSDSFLTNILTAYTNTTDSKSTKQDIINSQNMFTLTKAITHYARQRLYTLQHQLQSINNLLPQDEQFDKTNVRHKKIS
jgi:hypothetical protein